MTLVMIIFMCCLTILSVSGLHPTANNSTNKNSTVKTTSSLPAASLPPVLSPQLPYLEVDGKRVTSSPSSSSCTPTDPSTLTSAFSLAVREKTVINVRCVVEGAPVTGVQDINWFVNNQNVTHLSQFLMEYSAPTDKYTSQSLLTINVTKDFHCKLLSCSVEHPAWNQPVVTTAIFDVLYEPFFSISRDPGFGFPLLEGITVTLKCDIDANPWSQPTWIRDTSSSPISISEMDPPPLRTDEEGSFTIISAKVTDSGWYRCVTDHEFGHFTSFGYFLNIRSALPKLPVEKWPLSHDTSSDPSSISLGQNGQIPSEPRNHGLGFLSPSSSRTRTEELLRPQRTRPPARPSDAFFSLSHTSNLYHQSACLTTISLCMLFQVLLLWFLSSFSPHQTSSISVSITPNRVTK